VVDVKDAVANVLHGEERLINPRLNCLQILGPFVTRAIEAWLIGADHDQRTVWGGQVRPRISTF